jgi:hypothetical protein
MVNLFGPLPGGPEVPYVVLGLVVLLALCVVAIVLGVLYSVIWRAVRRGLAEHDRLTTKIAPSDR